MSKLKVDEIEALTGAGNLTVKSKLHVSGVDLEVSSPGIIFGKLSEGTPAGTIIASARSTSPTGYLLCNGASLSTTTYADLFAAIGYTYGGAGANFNIPDTQGAFLRSAGTSNFGASDVTIALGSRLNDAFQHHRYYYYFDNDVWLITTGTTFAGSFNVLGSFNNGQGNYNLREVGFIDGGTGAGTPRTAIETRPKSVAVNYFIKF